MEQDQVRPTTLPPGPHSRNRWNFRPGALGVFLDSDLRVDSAAARLNVHPNTLRHGLKRYEEVSGLPPTRVEDTILIKEAKDE